MVIFDGFGILWLLSIIWVWYECDQLKKNGVNVSSMGWPISVALLWIICFPWFCFKRAEYWRLSKQITSRKEGREIAKRFDCPECGESIAIGAKSCRFCQAIISDKERPKQRGPNVYKEPQTRAPRADKVDRKSTPMIIWLVGGAFLFVVGVFIAVVSKGKSAPTPQEMEAERIRRQNMEARELNERLARERDPRQFSGK